MPDGMTNMNTPPVEARARRPLDLVGAIARSLDLAASTEKELRNAVELKGLPSLILEAKRLGIKYADTARVLAREQKMALYPCRYPEGDDRNNSDAGKKPLTVVHCTEHWLLASNRVLYAWNHLDTESYASAYKLIGEENIRAIGVIDHESLIRAYERGDGVKPSGAITVDAGAEGGAMDALINDLMYRAARDQASDIYFMPQPNELVIRFKIDGEARVVTTLDFSPVSTAGSRKYRELSNRLLSRSGGQTGYYRETFDGAFVYDGMTGRTIKARVAGIPVTLPNATEPFHKYTIRLLGNRLDSLNLEDLGIPKDESNPQLTQLRLLAESKHGIVLVTGPTGSGKTTTLTALVQTIKTIYPEKEIITLEDPVEIFIDGVNHAQVNEQMSYAQGLKNILRQAPDIILVGEIRNLEVASEAITASQTGHLVLSTLHTNGAIATIGRLRDIGMEPYNIADTVRAITAQRLCKKVCPHCAIDARWGDLVSGQLAEYKKLERMTMKMHYLSINKNYTDLRWLPPSDTIVLIPRMGGCPKCNGQGYRGRVMISELLQNSMEIESMIIGNATPSMIHHVARERYGFLEMWEHAMQLITSRQITFDHAIGSLSPRPGVIGQPSSIA